MKLNEAIKNGIPLAITTEDGGRRYMADAFIVPGGLVFLDTGWASSEYAPNNPVHRVDGKIKGDGPWTVGGQEIEQMLDGDPLADEHNGWNQYRQGSEGKQYGTRTKAWAAVMNSGLAEENLT